MVAVVVAIVVSNSGDEDAPSVASSSPTTGSGVTTTPANPTANSGPFTGTYSVQFGPTTRWNGEPWPNSAPAYTETWRLRSACTADGCVATAAAGNQYPSSSLVFDKIGDRWIAVTNSQGKCKDMDGELWNSLSLQPGPDGAMSGDFSQTQSNGCLSKRTVTLRRTGDVDLSSLPDPATQSPRVKTPADALHGRYHEVLKLHTVHEYDNGVRTDCLRNGTRCMSYFVDLGIRKRRGPHLRERTMDPQQRLRRRLHLRRTRSHHEHRHVPAAATSSGPDRVSHRERQDRDCARGQHQVRKRGLQPVIHTHRRLTGAMSRCVVP